MSTSMSTSKTDMSFRDSSDGKETNNRSGRNINNNNNENNSQNMRKNRKRILLREEYGTKVYIEAEVDKCDSGDDSTKRKSTFTTNHRNANPHPRTMNLANATDLWYLVPTIPIMAH